MAKMQEYGPGLMKTAVKAVKDGMSYRDEEKKFKIKLQDQTFRHVKGKRKLFLGEMAKRLSSQEFCG